LKRDNEELKRDNEELKRDNEELKMELKELKMERLRLYAGNLLIALGKMAFPKLASDPRLIGFSRDYKPSRSRQTWQLLKSPRSTGHF